MQRELFPNQEHRSLNNWSSSVPLATSMRPRSLDEFLGNEALVGDSGVLKDLIKKDHIPSMIFWGPPGCGKTSLAYIVAETSKASFVSFSAVMAGVTDIRKVAEQAKEQLIATGRKTILFIDEIHRFNKAQQDAILPYVESGLVTLIGGTTENPSLEVIGALLSRCKIFVLEPLSPSDIRKLIELALNDAERGAWEVECFYRRASYCYDYFVC